MNHRGFGNGYPSPIPYPVPTAAPAGRPISPQWLAVSAKFPQDQVALAQAMVSGNPTAIQAAQQAISADQAVLALGPYAAAPASTSSSSTPYILAGIIGVVLVGGLIYAATK